MNAQQEKPTRSLSNVHGTVEIPKRGSAFRRMLAFAGPAYLVSVGYMDPGNWATDIEGGARFGYQLIWILLMSNLMAVLLQTLAARLGIVTGRDLAQACRENYSKSVSYILWGLCEIAIAACDLAEVLGTAIGINLLTGIPMIIGVIITGFDTLLFLALQNFGIRKLEAFILSLVAVIGICFGINVFIAGPVWSDVVSGFVPKLNSESLYIAIGIIGATVMPHNLYLHSALVQSRIVKQTDEGKRRACKYNLIDTGVALNAAFFVNTAILVLSATVFFKNGLVVTEIKQAHELLSPLLGTAIAGTLFATALICAGQSSTLTGTLAGQIVMEGFLRFKIRPFVRRLVTRLVAIIPAVIVIAIQGERGSYSLLILSQVILSMQLPFAIIPLIHFTSDKYKMGNFANTFWMKVLAWVSAVIIVVLNANLVITTLGRWIAEAGSQGIWIWMTLVPLAVGCVLLLIYISWPKSWRKKKKSAPLPLTLDLTPQHYTRIGVAIDYGHMDAKVLSHARSLALQNKAVVHLFHVVEGVSGQVYGEEAFDDEAREDKLRLETIAVQLRNSGIDVHYTLGYGSVAKQLIKLSTDNQIDLLVMGGHRHTGLKDFIFGTSISEVRHALPIPVLVVQ